MSVEPRSPKPVTGPIRSVIIDDNESFVDLISQLLAADGFEVIGAAGDREQGLRIIDDLRPELVLVDLYLGATNGLDLVADLVDAGLAEETFVILTSSCPVEELSELFACSAANAYLPKLELSGNAVRDLLLANGHATHTGEGQA